MIVFAYVCFYHVSTFGSNSCHAMHVRLYSDVMNIAEKELFGNDMLLHDGFLVGLFANLIWMRLVAKCML